MASASELPTSTSAAVFHPADTAPRTPTIESIPIPSPLPTGSVLIKLSHAALNPVDTQIMHYPPLSYAPSFLLHQSIGLGKDFLGTVIATGPSIDHTKYGVGKRVVGLLGQSDYFKAPGTLSEYVVVDVESTPIVPVPDGAAGKKEEELVGLPLVGLTARSCLEWLPPVEKTKNKERREVVVIGASGGVGILAVQCECFHFMVMNGI